jgi:hypothetical protein
MIGHKGGITRQYAELEEYLTFFDNASKDYEKYSRGNSENDMECAGFISRDLHEMIYNRRI